MIFAGPTSVDGVDGVCPANNDLDSLTHFNSDQEYSFEVDIWVIGNLIINASEVGVNLTKSQENIGMNITNSIKNNNETLSIVEVIEMIRNMPKYPV
jgi:hypothetical protein